MAPEALAVVDEVVGAVEVVDGTVVEVLAPVVVLEWLTVDVGGVAGDTPQETRPRVEAASAAIVLFVGSPRLCFRCSDARLAGLGPALGVKTRLD